MFPAGSGASSKAYCHLAQSHSSQVSSLGTFPRLRGAMRGSGSVSQTMKHHLTTSNTTGTLSKVQFLAQVRHGKAKHIAKSISLSSPPASTRITYLRWLRLNSRSRPYIPSLTHTHTCSLAEVDPRESRRSHGRLQLLGQVTVLSLHRYTMQSSPSSG